ASTDGTAWWAASSVATEALWCVDSDCAGGMWVAVGDGGTILTSTTGTTWTLRSGVSQDLRVVAYGGGSIVGHRIAPALDLTPVRVVGSSQVTWEAVQPLRAYEWRFVTSTGSNNAPSGNTYGMKFRLNKPVKLSRVGLEKGSGTDTFHIRI